MKRPLLALFLSISLLLPAYRAGAANFVEPMVKAWQMMDSMRQMMEWFIGGSNGNYYRNQSMPFGTLNPNLYGNNRNLASPYRRYPIGSETIVVAPRVDEGEWLRDPSPREDNFWGDDPYWDGAVVPLGEGYPASRSGYEGFDGIWRVNTGERWMIQGNQFMLKQANGAITKGEYTIKNDWIVIRHYDSNMTTSLQFRQMDDLLLIRDRSGSAALLHRLSGFRTPYNYGGNFQ